MLKRFFKNILSRNFILPFKKGRRFIFIYHDISDPGSLQYSENYSTSIERFKEQISFLSDKFEWVDLDNINRAEPFKKNAAALVFDDGFKSVQTNALPFLNEKKIPFAVFACQSAVTYNRLWVSDLVFNKQQLEEDLGPDFVKEIRSENNFQLLQKNKLFQNKLNSAIQRKFEKEQIYLNAEDIASLHKQGVIIGNHGSAHANLQQCSEKNIELEIVDNKLFIEKITGSPIKHYAIAFGKKEHFSPEALSLITTSGHSFVYSSNPSSYIQSTGSGLIPRIGITENSTQEIMFYINRQFLKKINL